MFDLFGNAIPLLNSVPNTLAETWFDRFWFRNNGSTFAPATDAVYYYIFFISAFFFILLMGLLVYFGIKYRRKPGVPAPYSPAHNTALELTWSIIPTILFAIMFIWGARTYLKMVVSPSDAETIEVSVWKWQWEWTYPNGATPIQSERVNDRESSFFALPVDTNVKFIMSSQDVIHSFYIPDFRIKRDCFPNRFTTVWARPTTITHRWDETEKKAVPVDPKNPGYFLFCAEYCGDQHSQMANRVAVLSRTDYQKWLEAQADTSSIPLLELGDIVRKAAGCNACHSVDGSAGSAPTWLGIWNQPRPGSAEGKVTVNYIRESTLDPGAYVVPGWPNNMISYQGRLTDREILALAVYIQSLNPEFAADAQQRSLEELQEQQAGEEQPPTPTDTPDSMMQ